MRKVAANIVVKDIATKYINHIIEIDNGSVIKDYPLLTETENIEWIGGMVVFSPYNHIDKKRECKISDFIKKYTNPIYADNLYAWHISGIDISADSVITDKNLSQLQ